MTLSARVLRAGMPALQTPRQLETRATNIIEATIAMKKGLRLRVRFMSLCNRTEDNHDYRQKGSRVAALFVEPLLDPLLKLYEASRSAADASPLMLDALPQETNVLRRELAQVWKHRC